MANPRFLALVYRGLAVAFLLTGTTFFVAPHGTVDFMNAVGAALGFTPAPAMPHRFWLSLGSAYMAVVTVLAWMIAADPVGRRPMMLALAAGKATSSLTCLYYLFADAAYFVYLANFIVDLSLAVLALVTYAATRNATPGGTGTVRAADGAAGGALGSGDRGKLGAALEAMLPPGADVAAIASQIEGYFRALGPTGPGALRGMLAFLEAAPLLTRRHVRRLSRLSVTERLHVLEAVEGSRLALLRLPLQGFKLIVMMHYYDRPEVKRAISYEAAYFEAKLADARARRADGRGFVPPERTPQ